MIRKIILLFLILVTSYLNGKSQTFADYVNNWRAYNNINVTSKTAPRSITPQNVGGGIGDSLAKWLIVLCDTVHTITSSSCLCTLEDVLTNGNVADNFIKLDDGVYSSILQDDALHFFNGVTNVGSVISNYGGGFAISFKDLTSSNYSLIRSGVLTSSRLVLLPDEGDGTGVDATLVLHTTKDAITINDGVGVDNAVYAEDSFSLNNGLGDITKATPTMVRVKNTGTTTVELLQMGLNFIQHDFTNSVGSVAHTTRLDFQAAPPGTTIADIWMPDYTHDGDTLATKGDGWNLGAQRWDGDYTQHVAKHTITFDSGVIYNFNDTLGKILLNLNDTANYSNSIGYISNRIGEKRISFKSANGLGEFFLTNSASSNNSKVKAGSAVFTGSQASGICNTSLVAGASSDALLQVDSAIGGINIYPKVAKYNNVLTAGYGVPAIYASDRLTAQTAAIASVTVYTVSASDGSFEVSANVNVTTSSAENFAVNVDYTDETNTARSQKLMFTKLAGTKTNAIASITGAEPYAGDISRIRCKAATTITVTTTGTFTGCTYNIEADIKQVK